MQQQNLQATTITNAKYGAKNVNILLLTAGVVFRGSETLARRKRGRPCWRGPLGSNLEFVGRRQDRELDPAESTRAPGWNGSEY